MSLSSLPKISIVTPSYNQGKYIEKTILSVLEQGYPNLEYIIIDGESTDESVEIIKKYADRLTYWVSEPDRGQSHAINKGFERATGEIFGWLNSDDWFAPGALQTVAEVFAANPEAGAVVGAGEMVDEDGSLVLHCESFQVTVDALYRWHERFFWQPSCFFTRHAWESCGPLDEQDHFAMDLALWFRIAEKYTFATTAALISYNLKHQEAKTSVSGPESIVEAAFVMARHGGDRQCRQGLAQELARRDLMILEYDKNLSSYAAAMEERGALLRSIDRQRIDLEQQLAASNAQVETLLNSMSWKVTAPLRWLLSRLTSSSGQKEQGKQPHLVSSYAVKQLYPLRGERPRIVHALANFMTGGSSRLVVDLLEHLGHCYEQEVITYFWPDPPHYTNLTIHEFRDTEVFEPILAYLEKFRPVLLHVHYWGDVDAPWYDLVFKAAERYGCKIIENVNTPVMPHCADSVCRYVFVSDYVKTCFGAGLDRTMTIHPGSDFALFTRAPESPVPDDCIGMVYRLEKDKLNEETIEVFIKIAKRRPGTKILIVGGGTFLEPYRRKAVDQGVGDSFIFTDYVPYETLPAYYAQMSLFVAPVWKESFGQVTPFAMSMGIPVVGYDVGALGEIVNNPGLLAPPGDSDRLAEIAIGLLDDRERRLRIGERNQQRCRELFSVGSMVQEYGRLYADLLRKGE